MLGGQELLVIAIVALLLFGAPRMIEWAKALGKAKSEFKKAEQEIIE